MPSRMNDVYRRNVEGRWHTHLSAKVDETAREVDAGRAVIEASVDMGRLDREEAFGCERLTILHEQPHGMGRCGAMLACQQRAVDGIELHHRRTNAKGEEQGLSLKRWLHFAPAASLARELRPALLFERPKPGSCDLTDPSGNAVRSRIVLQGETPRVIRA